MMAYGYALDNCVCGSRPSVSEYKIATDDKFCILVECPKGCRRIRVEFHVPRYCSSADTGKIMKRIGSAWHDAVSPHQMD